MKGGTTTLVDKASGKKFTHTTQDYGVGTYLIINNDARHQGVTKKSSYNYHRYLRKKLESDPSVRFIEDESTPLSMMAPEKKTRQRYKQPLGMYLQGGMHPFRGKHIVDWGGGKFYLAQPATLSEGKAVPVEGELIIVEARTGVKAFDAPKGFSSLTKSRQEKVIVEELMKRAQSEEKMAEIIERELNQRTP